MGGRSTIGMIAVLVLAVTAAPAGAATFKEYSIGANPEHAPRYIKAGPDGNLWFADGGTKGGVGRISPQGELFTEFGSVGAVELAFGPDGSVFWAGDKDIGERTRGGEIFESSTPVLNYAAAVSPSGEYWFSTKNASWCHPPVFTEEAVDPQKCQNLGTFGRITSIAFDRSGDPWGAFFENNTVRELGGSLTRVDLPTSSGPARIALGPEGDLWVTMFEADAIDRITPGGQRTRFPLSPGAGPNDIVLGPDGAFWFVEYKANKIGRMTAGGVLTGEFPIPTANAQPIGIAAGPDGAIWFTESLAAKIGRLSIDPSTTTPVPGVGGTGVAADTTPPTFTKAPSLHPSRFRSTGRAGGRIPKGSALTFALSEASSVKAQVATTRPGRRSLGACVGVTKSNRGKPHCRRSVTIGSLGFKGGSGADRFAFSARVAGHALRPGEYRLTVVATDAAGNGSAPAKLSFTIAP